MIRRLYDWTLALAAHPHALWALALVSFAESSVFPIPPDVMLLPMVLAAPHRAWLIAFVCTAASVAGALMGYAIGALAFETVGEPVLTALGKADSFDDFTATYNEYGAWVVAIAAFTPLPFKVVTILSGATGMSVPLFLVASVFARAARFFLVAGLLWKFGPPIRVFVERRLGLLSSLFVVLLIGSFVLVGSL
ncbi:YqaA family protein [Jannaschia seohaensis]|uniref:Membrane protein YqaA with SNARE-associated domain n=1 Tax=Jannaschia seohaensis TaxID=475081 RepID=A0A2Y9AK68_9RHOB|nr:YqaA family protein [Jannaschia seohaensis]PWJ20375.1 membrane protein YqaA with SNARE-associated domain [Jannaschia seohaensis]SSA44436.1 membrane protein YqaA, SNARE-associated domain [Jannaschia seohaensis]